jgi:hypothetical protein
MKYEIKGAVELGGCNIYFSAHRVALDGKSRKEKSLLQCFFLEATPIVVVNDLSSVF